MSRRQARRGEAVPPMPYPAALRVLALLQAGEGRALHDDLLTQFSRTQPEMLRVQVSRLRRFGYQIERVEHCCYRLIGGAS